MSFGEALEETEKRLRKPGSSKIQDQGQEMETTGRNATGKTGATKLNMKEESRETKITTL